MAYDLHKSSVEKVVKAASDGHFYGDEAELSRAFSCMLREGIDLRSFCESVNKQLQPHELAIALPQETFARKHKALSGSKYTATVKLLRIDCGETCLSEAKIEIKLPGSESSLIATALTHDVAFSDVGDTSEFLYWAFETDFIIEKHAKDIEALIHTAVLEANQHFAEVNRYIGVKVEFKLAAVCDHVDSGKCSYYEVLVHVIRTTDLETLSTRKLSFIVNNHE